MTGHHYPLQVFYEDTDAMGVVYHANYLKFMERARTVFLQDQGFSLNHLLADFQIQFVLRHCQVRFFKPARLEDQLTVVTRVTSNQRAALCFEQAIYRDPQQPDTMLCSGENQIVCVNEHNKPCRIPSRILRELTK